MSTVILINSNGMGRADQTLQHTLVASYLALLQQQDPLPRALCFYGEGVRLIAEGSPVLAHLEHLHGRGVELIACRTCLSYLGILDQVRAGRVGTMAEILEAQMRAEKVITL